MGVVLGSRRARGIALFSALVLVLVDVVFYVVGRLILIYAMRRAWDTSISSGLTSVLVGSPFARYQELAYGQRDLVVLAGDVVLLIVGVVLSWAIWQGLRLDRARASTQWTLGCSMSLGIIETLVSTWTFWASSYLRLPSSFFPELSASWGGWRFLENRVPTYEPGQWWLVPVLSSVFLICAFVAVALRAAYARLFEKK
jgi:hypothetical protein